jgi:hypothetical protein
MPAQGISDRVVFPHPSSRAMSADERARSRYYRYRLEVIEAFERGERTRTTQPQEVA